MTRRPPPCSGRSREAPPAAAARRPGRVVSVSFDGPPIAFNRSSVRSFRCGLPSMQFAGCRAMRRLRRAFRQRPQASSTRLFFAAYALPRDRLLLGPAIRHGRETLPPRRHDASRHDSPDLPRLLPGRPRTYRKVRGNRLPSEVCPCRCGISDMAYRALRGASPRPPRYDRGVARRNTPFACPGRVAPTDARVAPWRIRLPGLRVSPITAAALRSTPNCSGAPRTCPGLPGGPGNAV